MTQRRQPMRRRRQHGTPPARPPGAGELAQRRHAAINAARVDSIRAWMAGSKRTGSGPAGAGTPGTLGVLGSIGTLILVAQALFFLAMGVPMVADALTGAVLRLEDPAIVGRSGYCVEDERIVNHLVRNQWACDVDYVVHGRRTTLRTEWADDSLPVGSPVVVLDDGRAWMHPREATEASSVKLGAGGVFGLIFVAMALRELALALPRVGARALAIMRSDIRWSLRRLPARQGAIAEPPPEEVLPPSLTQNP